MANNQGGKFYSIQVSLTAAAGASVSNSPAKEVGSFPFRWEELGAKWGSNGDWDIKITDNGRDQAFSADKISVQALIGSSDKAPYELKTPHTFDAGSSIMIEATNNGAGADTIKIVFIGKRLPAGMPAPA